MHDIGLIAGNSQCSATVSYKEYGMYEGSGVQPDIVPEDEILCEVPADLSQGYLSVAYSESTYEGDISVYWGARSRIEIGG